MAAVQHTRTRSARLMAGFTNNNKSAQHHSAHTPSAPNHGVSALSLFLTNLRLLDLDLRPDWPGISAETFVTTGNSAQGQKKRVQCVEWALYHLFALWDAEEARNKLKPFFPPLDQVQSLNLRAALLRALEQIKKNGVLGRDVLVRKTMLDECKGERLEDVLAAFSSAVLKRVVSAEAASSGEHPAVALELALEDRGYKDDKTELIAMTLAHKGILHRQLRSKATARNGFRDFAELLTVKERGIARRSEAISAEENAAGTKTVSDDAKMEMWQAIRNNWSGNDQWMETLLHGDASSKKDGFFDARFDRVWRKAQQGRLGELEAHSGGLLEQLDSRVQVQRERLEKWEGFRKKMCSDWPRRSPSKQKTAETKKRGIDLGFGAHEGLQVGRTSPRKARLGNGPPAMNQDYTAIVDSLKDELSMTEPKASSVLTFLQAPRARNLPSPQRASSLAEPEPEATSEVSDLEEGVLDEEPFPIDAPIRSFQTKLEISKRLPMRPKINHSEDSYTSNRTASRTSSSSKSARKELGHDIPNYCTTSSELEQSPDISRGEPFNDVPYIPPPSPKLDVEPMMPPSPERDITPSPTQELADQILESITQASPSPTKRTKPRPTLSLAERTRMSMARTSLVFPEHEELDLPLHPTTTNSVAAIPEESSQSLATDEHEDLLSRTRRSMAGFDKARQKAQIERRKSLRKSKIPPRREGSYFPKVEEQSILAEELIGEEDMEAVFRSRPKIKASPLPSPTKEWEGEEYF